MRLKLTLCLTLCLGPSLGPGRPAYSAEELDLPVLRYKWTMVRKIKPDNRLLMAVQEINRLTRGQVPPVTLFEPIPEGS